MVNVGEIQSNQRLRRPIQHSRETTIRVSAESIPVNINQGKIRMIQQAGRQRRQKGQIARERPARRAIRVLQMFRRVFAQGLFRFHQGHSIILGSKRSAWGGIMTRSAVFSNVSARPPGRKGRRPRKDGDAAPTPCARKAALAIRQTVLNVVKGQSKGHGSIGRMPRHGRFTLANQP